MTKNSEKYSFRYEKEEDDFLIKTRNKKRRMDIKYIVILELVQNNVGINITFLNEKIKKKGYRINYKNLVERIKNLKDNGYLMDRGEKNYAKGERKDAKLVITDKGKKALEDKYYKDKLSDYEKSKLNELATTSSGPKTYKVKLKCENCGWKGELELNYGEEVQSAMCEYCGVKGKLRLF